MYYLNNSRVSSRMLSIRLSKQSDLKPRNMAMARPVEPDKKKSDIETPTSVHEWMKVRWKNKNIRERIVHSMAQDDRMRSDPEEARHISDVKMQSLKNSLLHRGFCRESKPYDPPKDKEERLRKCFVESLPSGDKNKHEMQESWLDYQLSDHLFKFKFLTLCEARFDHLIPSSDLHHIKRIRDVLEYYSTPVRGVMSYNALIRQQDDLPSNLHIIPDENKWKPDERGIFAYDAFPGHPDPKGGIRKRQKFKATKITVDWPDI